MRRNIGLSVVALSVAMLAGTPAQAQLLNLGGSGSSPSVSVTTGGGSGGAGVSVDLDNSDSSDAVDVDLGAGGSNGTALNASVLGNGTDDIDAQTGNVTANADVLGIDSLFGDGGNDEGVLTDLFGSSGGLASADLSGGTGDANDVTVSGLTNDDGSDVTADLFGGTSTSNAVTLDLFGAEETSSTGGGGGVGNGGSAGIGGDSASNGGAGGSGSVGLDADGNVKAGAGAAKMRVAANGGANAAVCFTPDAQQVDHLLNRGTYDQSDVQTLSSSGSIDLVPVRVCPEARVRLSQAVEADQNIQWLQDVIAADAKVKAQLEAAGLSGDNVLAADTKGGKARVYVY